MKRCQTIRPWRSGSY